MAVPKRNDKAKYQGKKKDVSINECVNQFPDCPKIPNIKEKECKLCPFNKHLR